MGPAASQLGQDFDDRLEPPQGPFVMQAFQEVDTMARQAVHQVEGILPGPSRMKAFEGSVYVALAFVGLAIEPLQMGLHPGHSREARSEGRVGRAGGKLFSSPVQAAAGVIARTGEKAGLVEIGEEKGQPGPALGERRADLA